MTWKSELRALVLSWRHRPLSTLLCTASLALAAGGSTVLFSIVRGVVFSPLPFPQPAELVSITYELPEMTAGPHSPANYLDLRARARTFSAIGGYRQDWFDVVTSRVSEPLRLRGAWVTASFFDVLSPPALVGRTLGAVDAPGSRRVLISEAFWRRSFSNDDVGVGASIRLNDESYTVVGVVGTAHAWPADIDVWALGDQGVPDFFQPVDDLILQRDLHYIDVVARLRHGMSVSDAQTDLDLVTESLRSEHPAINGRRSLRVASLVETMVGGTAGMLWLAFGGALAVFAIACANVAGILVPRALERRRDVAIRRALGASPGRAILPVIFEGTAIAGMACGAGALIARAGLQPALAYVPDALPRHEMVAFDWRAVLFVSAICLAAALAVAIVPARDARRVDVVDVLRGAGSRSATGRSTGHALLVVAQIGLTLPLLVVGGLLARTVVAIGHVDPGFRPGTIVSIALPLPRARYLEEARQVAVYERVLDGVRAHPGIRAAALAYSLPLAGGANAVPVEVEGAAADDPDRPTAAFASVSPEYFQVMRIPILQGRAFDSRDVAGGRRVVVVSRTAAERFWPDRPAIGRQMRFGSPDAFDVVGVVGDVLQEGLDADVRPAVYFTFRQVSFPFSSVLLQTDSSERAVETLRAVLGREDPGIALGDVQPLSALVSRAMAWPRFRAVVLAAFASVAVLLAVLGLYGSVTQLVTARRREAGIRVAMGASHGDLIRRFLGAGLRPVAIGLVLGLGLAGLASRAVAGLVFGVPPFDALTFVAAASALLLLAAVASYLPARRAARVDPVEVLRAEP